MICESTYSAFFDMLKGYPFGCPFSFLILRESNRSNATVRWTVTGPRLDGAHAIVAIHSGMASQTIPVRVISLRNQNDLFAAQV